MYRNVRRIEATDKPERGRDGKRYRHDFQPGCIAAALPGGRKLTLTLKHGAVLLFSKTQPLHEDIDV